MPRTRAQGLVQQQTGVELSPPQSLPQTRRVRKRIAQPAAESDNSENQDFFIPPAPSPTPSEDNALVYIWVSPSRSTIAAKHTTVKANIKIVVPRKDILNFLDIYNFDSDSTATVLASRKRRSEDAHEGSPPNKRARTETMPPTACTPPTASAPPTAASALPTTSAPRRARTQMRPPTTSAPRRPRTRRSPVRVLSVPAYDRHGNLVLAGDADDPELSLFEEIPLYTANTTRGLLARFTRNDNTQRIDNTQREVQHIESQAEPEAVEVVLAVQPQDEVDAPIEIPVEIPTEIPIEIPIENPTETPIEPPVQTPSRGWRIGSVLGSVRAASRLLPGFRRAPLNIADGNQNGTTDTPTVAHIDTSSITTATTATNGYIFTANNGVETVETNKQTEKHSRKKLSKAPKKSFKSSEERKAAHMKRKQEKIDEQKMQEEERRKAMIEANKREIENEVTRKVYYALKAEHEAAAATGVKRKRFSPLAIPNPVGCSYGMDLEFFGGDSDEEEEVSATVEPELGPQPESEPEREREPSPSLRAAKRVRFTADTRFPSELPSKLRQSNVGGSHVTHHNTARDSTDHINFPAVVSAALSSERSSFLGSNIFNNAPQSHISAQPATDNRTFTVPDESDSDESLLEPANTDEGKGKGVDWSTRNVGSTEPWQQDPPPPPTPSHAALPGPKFTSMEEESLARLRSEALRFTPKQPSTLRSVSRLSSSTVASSDAGDNEQTIETPAQSKSATHEVFRELAAKAQAEIQAQRRAQAQQEAPVRATEQQAHDEGQQHAQQQAQYEAQAQTQQQAQYEAQAQAQQQAHDEGQQHAQQQAQYEAQAQAQQQAQYEAQAQAQQQAQYETQAQAQQQAQYEAQAQAHNQYQNHAQTPVASRGVLREISGNDTIWIREMEDAQAKYATQNSQQQFHMDPMVTDLVNAIPDRDLIQFDPNIAALVDRIPEHDLIQFEFPGLGHSQMDPTVEALLNAIPDENLIRFDFPSRN